MFSWHSASCAEAAQLCDSEKLYFPSCTATNCFPFLSVSYSHLLPASSESDTARVWGCNLCVGTEGRPRADDGTDGRTDGWTDEEQSGVKELQCRAEMNWCVWCAVAFLSACQRSDSRRAARPDANSETRGQDYCRNPSDSQQRCIQQTSETSDPRSQTLGRPGSFWAVQQHALCPKIHLDTLKWLKITALDNKC